MILEDFRQYLESERGYSEHTLRAYMNDMDEFTSYISKPYDEVTRQDIVNFISHLRDTVHNSTTTTNRKLASIKSFFKFMVVSGRIRYNPTVDVSSSRIPKKLPKPLTTQELDSLSNVFNIRNKLGLRNKAIVEAIFGCGLRVDELVKLKITAIDFINKTVNIYGKGSRERVNPINDYALDLVQKYLRSRNYDSVYVFANPKTGQPLSTRSVCRVITNYAKKAGITRFNVSPHALRHSFATEMLNNGADIREIQELLGHANLNTTQIYTHISRARLQARYNEIHPRSNANEE